MTEAKKKVSLAEKKAVARAREARRRAWFKRLLKVPGASGPALRAWRQDRAISQKDLAVAWGMSRRTIIRLERRGAVPRLVSVAMEVK